MLWFTEKHTGNVGLSFRVKSARRERSRFQEILLLDTYEYGKMLVLDGAVQTTERDEFIYHEMIAHIPLFTLPRKPERVLIIGGGDGGTAREVLKHSPGHVDLVEIDREVVEFCRRELPSLSASLDDERVSIHFMDGRDFIRRCSSSYDAVIVDCSDPVGPSKVLFESDFYRDISSVLSDGGVFVTQSESPLFHTDTVRMIQDELKKVFSVVRLYLAFIPTYPSGMWSFTFASNSADPLSVDRDVLKSRLKGFADLKYYNCDVHFGAFAVPQFLKIDRR